MSCVRGCCVDQRTHYKSVTINTTVASPQRKQDRNESADMDAYKRLRADGVQPKQISGSAELERNASTVHEIENSNIITDRKVRDRVTKAFEVAAPPSATPIS